MMNVIHLSKIQAWTPKNFQTLLINSSLQNTWFTYSNWELKQQKQREGLWTPNLVKASAKGKWFDKSLNIKRKILIGILLCHNLAKRQHGLS